MTEDLKKLIDEVEGIKKEFPKSVKKPGQNS